MSINEEYLKRKAKDLRISILDSIFKCGKGHIGGAYSIVEILVTLYYGKFIKFNAKNPFWSDRDRFILSKGHAGVSLYCILADLGFFSKGELLKLNSGGLLGEHPDHNIPGIECVTGSLGHGLSIGAGMALAEKIDGTKKKTIVLLGDGECYEGSIWESIIFANNHKLYNLCAIVDRNKLITHGSTEKINKLEPFIDKWKAFGWKCIEINAHSFNEINSSLSEFYATQSGSPTVIIANSIKGKGISFMEGKASWHHGAIREDDYQKGRIEILGGF